MNPTERDDLEPSPAPGYWRVKGGCPGGERCTHAFRGALGPCAGGVDLTVYYRDPTRDARGRFASPYRTWLKAVTDANIITADKLCTKTDPATAPTPRRRESGTPS